MMHASNNHCGTTTVDMYRRRYGDDDDDDDTEQTRPSLACPHFHSLPSIHLASTLPWMIIWVRFFHLRGRPSSSTTWWFCCCLSAWFVCSVFSHEDSPRPTQDDDSVAYQLDLCTVFSSTRTPLMQHNTMILLPINLICVQCFHPR